MRVENLDSISLLWCLLRECREKKDFISLLIGKVRLHLYSSSSTRNCWWRFTVTLKKKFPWKMWMWAWYTRNCVKICKLPPSSLLLRMSTVMADEDPIEVEVLLACSPWVPVLPIVSCPLLFPRDTILIVLDEAEDFPGELGIFSLWSRRSLPMNPQKSSHDKVKLTRFRERNSYNSASKPCIITET